MGIMRSNLSLGALGALLVCGGAACSDDPVSYSAPVGINLKAKSGDTTNSVVSDEKGITTESGNPYGKFISDARAALGGHDPARIEIEGVELLLGARSTGVTRLGEIFDGELTVLFRMDSTDNSFVAASRQITADTGGGPIALGVSFDSNRLAGDDWTKLLGGSFKVVVRAPAAADFEDKGAEADLQVTFTFGAYE
jgi:hypothetical protein